MSNTDDHEGWVFYTCINHGVSNILFVDLVLFCGFGAIKVEILFTFFGFQLGCDFWHWEMEYVAYLVDRQYLVGNQVVDVVGAREDRREELIRARNERRRIAGRMAADRAAMARPSSLQQKIRKQHAGALLGLGAEMLLQMK